MFGDNAGCSGILLAVAIVVIGFLALASVFGPILAQVQNVIP